MNSVSYSQFLHKGSPFRATATAATLDKNEGEVKDIWYPEPPLEGILETDNGTVRAGAHKLLQYRAALILFVFKRES